MFGKRLRYLRERKGMTQKELAKQLNIPNQNISNYEREFRHPDFGLLKIIANYFEVTTDYLLGHSDDPNKTENEELEDFIKDVRVWFKDEPDTNEEKLKLMKKMFRVLKED